MRGFVAVLAGLLLIAGGVHALTPAQAAEMIKAPKSGWTTTPKRVMAFLAFMHATGAIREQADNWHQVFFPSAHGADGG